MSANILGLCPWLHKNDEDNCTKARVCQFVVSIFSYLFIHTSVGWYKRYWAVEISTAGSPTCPQRFTLNNANCRVFMNVWNRIGRLLSLDYQHDAFFQVNLLLGRSNDLHLLKPMILCDWGPVLTGLQSKKISEFSGFFFANLDMRRHPQIINIDCVMKERMFWHCVTYIVVN